MSPNMPSLDGTVILEALPGGAILLDQDACVCLINNAAIGILGIEAGAAVGRPITELHGGFELDRPGAQQAGELDLPGYQVRYRVAPIVTGAEPDVWQGRLILLEVSAHDIFARRDTADTVAALVHDLRAPLTTITSYANLLLLGTIDPLSDSQHQFISVMKANAGRLLDELNNLVTAYRVRSGLFELDREDLDIVSIVREVATTRADSYALQDLKLTIDSQEPEIMVSADQRGVWDIVSSLLDNACRRSQPAGEVIVAIVNDDDAVRVTVQDADTSCLSKELFARRHTYLHQPLAVAHDLVKLHDGRLWVESVQGQGCVVHFTLPRAAA
jgi:two-component system sensor histidine kinase VicK